MPFSSMDCCSQCSLFSLGNASALRVLPGWIEGMKHWWKLFASKLPEEPEYIVRMLISWVTDMHWKALTPKCLGRFLSQITLLCYEPCASLSRIYIWCVRQNFTTFKRKTDSWQIGGKNKLLLNKFPPCIWQVYSLGKPWQLQFWLVKTSTKKFHYAVMSLL